jgi:hypothetical protein
MYGKRNHAETAFSVIGRLFGYRIRCRSKMGRKNEVHAKIAYVQFIASGKENYQFNELVFQQRQ